VRTVTNDGRAEIKERTRSLLGQPACWKLVTIS
jgi:hypothetical protein